MKAKIKVDLDRQIGSVDRNIYGEFICRRPGCSEGGLYDPHHSLADKDGLRKDVVEAIRGLKPPLIRWPGGCTGTSYNWIDGVGPIEKRPKKIDLHFGWPALYGFGTDEFIKFCRRMKTEPFLVWNMGTGTLEAAAAWLEYCNGTYDTYYANLRRKYGHEEPFNVKYWQLGNEMYGVHELGYCKAEEYASTAREWAKTMRRLDPSISIIAVGGGHEDVDRYRVVLEELIPLSLIDYISIHRYWGHQEKSKYEGKDAENFYQVVAGPAISEKLIQEVACMISMIRRKHKDKDTRKVKIAYTEWNAWNYREGAGLHPSIKPFEPAYHLREALSDAVFLNILQRNCREVTLATVAQPINVAGLLAVNDKGMVIEPTYWPLWMQVNKSGPISLDVWSESECLNEPSLKLEEEPYLDLSATLNPKKRKLYLSMVNRHIDQSMEAEINLGHARIKSEGQSHLLYHEDPMAMNSLANPDNVSPRTEKVEKLSSRFTWTLLPHSYTILEMNLV